MHPRLTTIAGLLAGSLLLAACQQSGVGDTVMPEIGYPQSGDQVIPPPAGFDVAEFEGFIATGPTPDDFAVAYPDIQLVMPMTPTTLEYRPDYSRFFAELNEDGEIIGGYFQ
ncbi:MAG: hypothetical protein AAFX92_03710 [Pseudomonadota bacterium]